MIDTSGVETEDRLKHASAAFPICTILLGSFSEKWGSTLVQPIVNCQTLRAIVMSSNASVAQALLRALKEHSPPALQHLEVPCEPLFSDALELVVSRMDWSCCVLGVPERASDEQWAALYRWMRAHRRPLTLSLRCNLFPDSFWPQLKHAASIHSLSLVSYGQATDLAPCVLELHPNLISLVRANGASSLR